MEGVPQGLTPEQFTELSTKVRQAAAHLTDDIVVHGSRAAGTANPGSDLDIAIRIEPSQFEQFLATCFGKPNAGSAKERTMRHAQTTGKIQAGEAGLRNLRRELETDLGIAVDVSVIRKGGPFDSGPFLALHSKESG